MLPGAEWLAENAFIPPGTHRLLTAGGLTLGLWAGRSFMDVVTARRSADGSEIQRDQVPELFRPIHGVLRYNPYSDAADDRWKFVADKMAPMLFGAFGAYFGGKLFFNGKLNDKAVHAASAAINNAYTEKRISTEIIDAKSRLVQSDATRKWASATFVEGSAMGMHMHGALWPFNNGMIAVSFQQGAGKNIYTPFGKTINRLLGNNGVSSRFLYGASRDTLKWMEANILKHATPAEWVTEEQLLRRAKDGLQKFYGRTAEVEQSLASQYRKLIEDGYAHIRSLPADKKDFALYGFLAGAGKSQSGMLGVSHDHMLRKAGIDLSQAKFARDPWSFFSNLFGAGKKTKPVLEEYARYLNREHGFKLDPVAWAAEQVRIEPWKATAAYGGAAAGIGIGLTAASIAAQRLNQKIDRHTERAINGRDGVTLAPEAIRARSHQAENDDAKNHDGSAKDWINGKPLDAMHWLSRVVITPPSMHRFMNAAYLSIVLYGGMKFANLLAGRNLTMLGSGNLARSVMEAPKGVLSFLKPLHGILAYTPGSIHTVDRARQAAHFLIPVGLGMFGTYTGSHLFFRDRIDKLSRVDTLEDYADKISMEQSKFYAGATALTSIFNTGSGIHLLPVFNYSSNLHNRYLLASGQQVAAPGVGKWWSGNAGLTPWGVKKNLQYMASYLTYNPAARPRELPSLVHSVLGKLYPDLAEDVLLAKKEAFINTLYEVRDSYLVDGNLPKEKQEAVNAAMSKILFGKGFEELLLEIGLNPGQANLASNGASGAIANFFGSKHAVEQIQSEYRTKFTERLANKSLGNPSDYLRQLADKSAATGTNVSAVNDNGAEPHAEQKSFAERLREEKILPLRAKQ